MDVLPPNTPPFISVAQFQELTGTSRGYAYALIRSRVLRAVRLGKRGVIRIPRGELRRFLEERALELPE